MKRAVVLAGGGARGAYQIGAWRALEENRFRPDIVCGTSIGAINGAFMAQKDYEGALEIWRSITLREAFDVDLPSDVIESEKGSQAVAAYYLRNLLKGGVGMSPLRGLLERAIDEERVRRSGIDYGLVTVKLHPPEHLEIFKDEIPPGKLVDYMLASAAFFPALRSQVIDGREYIDGGYYNNVPVDMAIGRGAEKIVVIDIGGEGIRRRVRRKNAEIINISTSRPLGEPLYFTQKSIPNNIELGYYDTQKAFGKYEGYSYIFENGTNLLLGKRYGKRFARIYDEIGLFKKGALLGLAEAGINGVMSRARGKQKGGLLPALECGAKILALEHLKVYTADEIIGKMRGEFLRVPEVPAGLGALFENRKGITIDEKLLLKAVVSALSAASENAAGLKLLCAAMPEALMGAVFLAAVLEES